MGVVYADDLVVIAETEDDLIERLNEWKDNVGSDTHFVNAFIVFYQYP